MYKLYMYIEYYPKTPTQDNQNMNCNFFYAAAIGETVNNIREILYKSLS